MTKIIKINDIEIELKKDYAIYQEVDLVFNSASGLLLMRTGTAKSIREYSEDLTEEEGGEYTNILNSFSNPIILKYIENFDVFDWKPQKAQLSCFKKIVNNKGPFNAGEIVLDKDWSQKYSSHVLHVVGMTYHLVDGELDVDKVTEKSLENVLVKSIEFAEKNKYKSIAIPVLCTRGDYGLNPGISFRAILSAIKNFKIEHIKKIIICFESEGPRKFYDELNVDEL